MRIGTSLEDLSLVIRSYTYLSVGNFMCLCEVMNVDVPAPFSIFTFLVDEILIWKSCVCWFEFIRLTIYDRSQIYFLSDFDWFRPGWYWELLDVMVRNILCSKRRILVRIGIPFGRDKYMRWHRCFSHNSLPISRFDTAFSIIRDGNPCI